MKCILVFVVVALVQVAAFSQSKYHPIPLPAAIASVDEEFSGITIYQNRLYLLPQYGSNKETKLEEDFFIYSIKTDSINRVLLHKDSELTAFKSISVKNLNLLPNSIKKSYQGFEAITIVNNQVFMAIETEDSSDYCYILKGTFNIAKTELVIDAAHFITLPRYPYIENAGFESLTWLPKEKKLLAVYEFNAIKGGGTGYLLDASFKTKPVAVKTPYAYFRITDIASNATDKIYAVNYHWNGDYKQYLSNELLRNAEVSIAAFTPALKDSLLENVDYLKHNGFAEIISLRNRKSTNWKHVATFPPKNNNWEGITLFKKGALIITDANRSKKQACILAFMEF